MVTFNHPPLKKEELKKFQVFVNKHPYLYDDYNNVFGKEHFTYRDAYEYEKTLNKWL